MSKNQRFLNPYNFVRYLLQGEEDGTSETKLLGRCAPPPHDRYLGLTGRIECELEAITPIFVSDSEFVDYDTRRDHKSYRFFRVKNEQGNEYFAIPSTSLRGMLRSVFEAVTNSCFSVFEGGVLGKREKPEDYDRELPLSAGLIIELPKSENKPGRVKKMKDYKLPHDTFPQYRNKYSLNKKKVLVKITDFYVSDIKEYTEEEKVSEGYIEGFLKTSDQGIPGKTRKRNEYVFVYEDPPKYFEFPYEKYQNYVIANRNNRHEHTKNPKVGDTIWFRPEGNQIREFGYAQIYRKPFGKSIGDLLPEKFHQCTDYYNLCPACRVFGWVHQKPPEELEKKVAYAGRIKISHAKIIENKGKLDPFPLAILSTPKPTTTYFYLFKNGENRRPDLHVTYDTPGAELRGRKFYRHQKEAKKQEYKRAGSIEDKQNRTLKDALKPGATFKFTIEFENLAPIELGALLWSIEMEDGMYHKLGLAKPLGFGSVKISIKQINKLDIKDRYASYSNDGWKEITSEEKTQLINSFKQAMENRYGKTFEELENVKDLKAILSAHPSDLPVHYPRISEQPDVRGRNFEWFMANKEHGEPLEIAAEDYGLPYRFNLKGKSRTKRG